MNKAQQLLQPLMGSADKVLQRARDRGDFAYGVATGFQDAMRCAIDALAALIDGVTLVDVPTVEWETDNEVDKHGEWKISPTMSIDSKVQCYCLRFGNECAEYWSTRAKARRYVEIKLYIADLERKLIAAVEDV